MLKHRVKKLEEKIISTHKEQLPVKLLLLKKDETQEEAIARSSITNTAQYRKIIFIEGVDGISKY